MGNLDALIKRLAKATGLPEDLAEAVIETAVDVVKAQRPEKTEQIDAALENEKVTQRAGDLIAKVAEKVKPESGRR